MQVLYIGIGGGEPTVRSDFSERQRELYDWLVGSCENILTGDSFFHLSARGDRCPGLNLCGAGWAVCLIDPVGDVYACPFAVHEELLARNVPHAGGFQPIWRSSDLFADLRAPQTGGTCASCENFDTYGGGCMGAKLFTGLRLSTARTPSAFRDTGLMRWWPELARAPPDPAATTPTAPVPRRWLPPLPGGPSDHRLRSPAPPG